jgi:hypothetical protein
MSLTGKGRVYHAVTVSLLKRFTQDLTYYLSSPAYENPSIFLFYFSDKISLWAVQYAYTGPYVSVMKAIEINIQHLTLKVTPRSYRRR